MCFTTYSLLLTPPYQNCLIVMNPFGLALESYLIAFLALLTFLHSKNPIPCLHTEELPHQRSLYPMCKNHAFIMFKSHHPFKLLHGSLPSSAELKGKIKPVFRFSRRNFRWSCRGLGLEQEQERER